MAEKLRQRIELVVREDPASLQQMSGTSYVETKRKEHLLIPLRWK